MSYMWYTCFGAMTTILVALVASLIVGNVDPSTIDRKLVAPCIRKYMPEPCCVAKKKLPAKIFHSDTIMETDEENCAKESAC